MKYSGVILTGQFFNRGGYSALLQNLAKSLSENGVAVRTLAYGLPEEQVYKDHGPMVEKLATTDVGNNPLIYSQDLPTNYRFVKNDNDLDHIGATLFETEELPDGWADILNTMSAVSVPSDFNIRTFTGAGVRNELLYKLPYGIETSIADADSQVAGTQYQLPEAAAGKCIFLYRFGLHYRKGFDLLLQAYLEEFDKNDDTALILSCFHVGASGVPLNKHQSGSRLREFFLSSLPSPGRLPDEEHLPLFIPRWEWLSEFQKINMMKSCSVYVSTERASGWSLPCMEALALERPVIATNYGPHLEFLDDSNAWLIDMNGEIEPVDQRVQITGHYYRGHHWAKLHITDIRLALRRAYEDAEGRKEKAAAGKRRIERDFSLAAMAKNFISTFNIEHHPDYQHKQTNENYGAKIEA